MRVCEAVLKVVFFVHIIFALTFTIRLLQFAMTLSLMCINECLAVFCM